MARLTLSFKGRLLASRPIDLPVLVVGSDPGCDLAIDSLAIAPRHLELREDGEAVLAIALDPAFAVLRNGAPLERAHLADGDLILIGKHTIAFSAGEPVAVLLPPREREAPAEAAPETDRPAYLQIQTGEHIGEIVPLPRAVNRLRRVGGREVIVTCRDRTYFLIRIGEANRVFVGRQAVRGDNEVALANGDLIEIDGIQCQFFGPERRG